MKKLLLLILTLTLAFSLCACGEEEPLYEGPAPLMEELDFSEVDPSTCTETDDVTEYVKINVSYSDARGTHQTGDIIIRLFPTVAPKTVRNFQTLVKNDFYNGSSFHRVVPNFMIQGGAGTANSASVAPIKGEFTENGFTNNLLHERGVISMARTSNPDSATSQFFIMHKDKAQKAVDGKYASFGVVVSGMNVVDGIACTDLQYNIPMQETSTPINPVTINYATFVTVN